MRLLGNGLKYYVSRRTRFKMCMINLKIQQIDTNSIQLMKSMRIFVNSTINNKYQSVYLTVFVCVENYFWVIASSWQEVNRWQFIEIFVTSVVRK